MKVAIDIHEVVADIIPGFLDYAYLKGCRRVYFKDIYQFDLAPILGVEKKKVSKLISDFLLNYEYGLIKGSKKGVEYLKEKHDPYFITASGLELKKITCDFIYDNFNISKDRVFFSGNIYIKGKPKDLYCKELDIGVIIEDNGIDSIKYADSGLEVLLLDKPWNQKFSHERIYRCENWKSVIKKIKEIDDGRVF